MDSKQFREAGKQVIDYIADYFENLEKIRVCPDVKPGFLLDSLPSTGPQHGEDFNRIFADYQNQIMPGVFQWNSPSFHALYPGGVSFPSILGELLAAATGGVCFSWDVNPSSTELEMVVLDWLVKLLDLPKEFLHVNSEQKDDGKKGGGIIQGSATESVLVCLLAARRTALDQLQIAHPDVTESVLLGKLVAYASELTHACIEKAKLVGLITLRVIETDEDGNIKIDRLNEEIEKDVAAGLHPFFLCANLGTTVACSFDNLEDVGPICKQWNMWLHVDAAYAGTFFVCPEYRNYLKGIEFADSFNFNCHKLMLTNFDCAPLWVKDRYALMNALSVERCYFKNDDSGIVTDFRKWQIPLGRRFRSLKLWFVLRSYGVEGLQNHVRQHLQRKKLFESLVEQDDRFEFWPRKQPLGLVCFRLKGSDRLTKMLADNINSTGKVALTVLPFKNQTIIRLHGGISQEDSHIYHTWSSIQKETDKILNMKG